MSVSSSSTSPSLLERLHDTHNADAWQKWLRLYTPLLRAWLAPAHLQPADGDDLTQRVLQVVVRKLPQFQHNGRPGAFRAWLHSITVNILREFRRGQARVGRSGSTVALVEEFEDPGSDLNRWWDQEHDLHVLHGLLELVEPEFSGRTWQAFRRVVFDEALPSVVAAELGMSANAVLIAKSRVLARLRQEARGLVP